MEYDKLKEWATNRFDKDSEIQRLNTNLEMLQKMRYSYGDMAHKHNMDKEYYLEAAQKIADKKMNISELYYDYLEHFRTDRTGLINRSPEERHLHEQLRDGYKSLLDYLSDLLQAVETKSKLAPSRKQTEKPEKSFEDYLIKKPKNVKRLISYLQKLKAMEFAFAIYHLQNEHFLPSNLKGKVTGLAISIKPDSKEGFLKTVRNNLKQDDDQYCFFDNCDYLDKWQEVENQVNVFL